MRYIALEEGFSLPGLADRQPMPTLPFSFKPEYAQDWVRRLADVEEFRLPEMDAAGIDVQVLSMTVPGLQVDLDGPTAVENARWANDQLAKMVAEHPNRLRGFAALPLQNPAAAADELRRCVGDLGFCGALVNNCSQAQYLDEPRFDVLWAAVARLGLPLYLHPGAPPSDRWDVVRDHPELWGAMWSWGAETAGHALRILYSGIFDRYPDATLVLGHMGEFLPYQRSRLDSRWKTIASDYHLERPPSHYVGTNIMFTNTGVFSPAALTGAVLEVGADTVMFSVDYPYESSAEAVDGFERTTLSDIDRHKIAHRNAERLLRISATPSPTPTRLSIREDQA
jgi:2,3-dihydroxybenzoate decarboxylase